jgi:large subunit ribosomal protein L30
LPSRKLKVTLTRSAIGLKPGHVRTLEALGLRRIRATVVHDDTAVIRGMIARVPYALHVEPIEILGGPAAGSAAPKTATMPKGAKVKERSA